MTSRDARVSSRPHVTARSHDLHLIGTLSWLSWSCVKGSRSNPRSRATNSNPGNNVPLGQEIRVQEAYPLGYSPGSTREDQWLKLWGSQALYFGAAGGGQGTGFRCHGDPGPRGHNAFILAEVGGFQGGSWSPWITWEKDDS